MKTVALAMVMLVLYSISLLACEYLMNDTSASEYGLRVVFSERVPITAFGDELVSVMPSGEFAEFIFSGVESLPHGEGIAGQLRMNGTATSSMFTDPCPPRFPSAIHLADLPSDSEAHNGTQ